MIVLDNDELLKLGVSPAEIIKAQDRSVKNTKAIKKEVNNNSVATLELAKAIKTLANSSKEAIPQDMSPLIQAIHDIQETQLNVLQLLEAKIKPAAPKTVDFFIARNKHGSIHKITAKEVSR